MGTSRPIAWLSAHEAQKDVIDGLARFDDWASLWNECPRGDWLLGIATRMGAEHTLLVRAAVACAKIADEPPSELAVAEAWLEGKATADEVAAAAKQLDAAPAHDPAHEAANRAAHATLLGIADRDVLASAAAAAVESIMLASIDCGLELAMRWAHDKCASAVRAALPWDVIAPCIERGEERG